MNKLYIALSLTLLLLFATACETKVELCEESVHPHAPRVSYSFLWDIHREGHETIPVDTMYVIANRVINQWKSSMVVSATDQPSRGYYFYTDLIDTQPREPETEPADTTGTALAEENLRPGVDIPTSEFHIKAGEYKFFAFNMDTTELIYNNVFEFMQAPPEENKLLRDVYVTYKTYPKDGNGGQLRNIIQDWTDYNPYAQYIQPDILPVYFDTLAVTKIQMSPEPIDVYFRPKTLTQDIDIYFNINKIVDVEPFVIDSIRAEISGIPLSVNLSNGYIDIQHTAKMMFTTTLIRPVTQQNLSQTPFADTPANTQLGCYAHINVPSLVANQSSDVFTGPGIMQVMIYTHSQNADPRLEGRRVVVKKIQGKINLYHTLTQAQLYEITDDGKHARRKGSQATLFINAEPITIDGEKIIRSTENNGGLDIWEPADHIIIDI